MLREGNPIGVVSVTRAIRWRWFPSVDGFQLWRGTGIGRIPQDADPRGRWHELFEEFEPFREQIGVSVCKARGVPTRTGQTGHESGADGIRFAHEHDGDRARDFLGRESAAGRCRNENIDLDTDELRGERGEPLDLPRRISLLDDDVLTFDVSKLPKPVPEGSEPGLVPLEVPRDE
jgi:hypothetical protein